MKKNDLKKELSVGDIAEVVGLSMSAVSHTLRKLKKSPVVGVMKDRINHYENI